jgi:hypothetical protein
MRVLCNYTLKNNGSGESYSITLEKMGDLKEGQVDVAIDELFALSKAAIQRQIDGEMEFPSREPEAAITIPVPRVAANHNGNGNGNGATEKQKAFLKKLRAGEKKGVNVDALSKIEASALIKELVEV